MTAAVLVDQVQRFKQAGMSDHVGKPFQPRELRRIIDRWIDADENGAGPAEIAQGPHSASATEMIMPATPA
jgi:hypothetical protein